MTDNSLQTIHSDTTISITEFRKNPSKSVEQAGDKAVAVLNNNKPNFYCISPERYEQMIEALDNAYLTQLVHERESEESVSVSLDEL